jgi:hypothetical protein
VRQNPKDVVDVQPRFDRRWRSRDGMSSVGHSSPVKTDDYTVTRPPRSGRIELPIRRQ